MEYRPDIFDELRRTGEDHKYICQLIREDSLSDFISYTTRQDIDLTNNIKRSNFDTNNFLFHEEYNLIDYAAFFGSINIFKYLFSKNRPDSSIWIFAIHGQNLEILRFLQENDINPKNPEYCLRQSIRSQHLEITDYLIKNIVQNAEIDQNKLFETGVECYNYFYYPTNDKELITDKFLSLLCETNNVSLFNLIIQNQSIDFNSSSLLITALKESSTEIAKVLLSQPNIDVNAKDKDHQFPLGLAARYGNKEITELLLKNPQIDVNNTNNLSETSLFLACENSNKEIVELLLKDPNIDLHLSNSFGSPLSVSIHKNLIDIANLLINHPKIDINRGFLTMAINDGNTEIAKLIINHPKIDINYASSEDRIPINVAIDKDNKEIIKILLNHPKIDIKSTQNKLFLTVVKKGNLEIVKLLLSHEGLDYNYNEDGQTALYCAVSNRHIEIVDFLMGLKKFDINFTTVDTTRDEKEVTKSTILHLAVEKYACDIVELLLTKYNLDINSKDEVVKYDRYNKKKIVEIRERTPLYIALFYDHSSMIELLISKENIEINSIFIRKGVKEKAEEVCSALHYEIEHSHYSESITPLLLAKKNVDVNMKYKCDFYHEKLESTPLFIASMREYPNIIKMLLKFDNIDVNALSICDNNIKESSYAALHEAVFKKNNNIVEILLNDKRVDVNLKAHYYSTKYLDDSWDKTALHYAVERKLAKIVEILLASPKIDVNIKTTNESCKDGNKTALHLAVESGNIEIINLLLNHNGIDKNALDKDGKKPIDYTDDENIKKLLL